VKFIQADTQLEERCIYDSHALHDHAPTPSREPLSTSTNLPAVQEAASNLVTAPPDVSPPCLFRDDPTLTSLSASSTLVSTTVEPASTLEQKRALFLSAPHFAVVGASTNDTKNGSKALKWLVKQNKDVVPVNPNATEIQGLKCIKSLSELRDPAHTSVAIVVPPKTTLDVLKLAKSLGIYAVWIQPGAEDDAVVEFIEADAQLKARCVYREHALHTTIHSAMVMLAANTTLHTDTLGPCLFAESTVSATASLPVAAPLVASNVVAGVKHVLSPPSTPPVNKSLKLSPDDDSSHVTDLGEEIPGLP